MSSSTLYIRPSMKFDLDIDELIREVHYRPAIWNKNCVGYTDRRLKARMWDEVCQNIIDNWNKLKILQKNTISNEIQKKWRNVKDAFKKEHKKMLGGQDVGKKRQYVHFKALSFLIRDSEIYNSNSAISLDESDAASDDTSADQDNTSASSTRKRTRHKNRDENEDLTMHVKREKFHFDEEHSNSEHNKQNTDSNNDSLLHIELEKPDFSEENADFVNRKPQNTNEYPDRHFVEIQCDDWDNEINSPLVSKIDQNKHFVKVHSDVKIYDEDIGFTEMMVPMLRRLNDDQKHFAKIEILNILHKAKKYNPSSSRETQTELIRPEKTGQ